MAAGQESPPIPRKIGARNLGGMTKKSFQLTVGLDVMDLDRAVP
jgi:hypothetical protein